MMRDGITQMIESSQVTVNGLFKAEVIHRRGPWRSFEAVEYATLEWVDLLHQRPAATSRNSVIAVLFFSVCFG